MSPSSRCDAHPPLSRHSVTPMAFFDFLKRNSLPADLAHLNVGHIRALLKRETAHTVKATCEKAADAGSADAAVFLASIFLQASNIPSPNQEKARAKFLRFAERAAELGDPTACFSLYKHHLSFVKLEEGQMEQEQYASLVQAERWLKEAARQGLAEAQSDLEEMEPVFAWAHEAFHEQEITDDSEEPASQYAKQPQEPNNLHRLIHNAGWETAVYCASLEVIGRIANADAAYRFFLEELDGASSGGDYARQFAAESGFDVKEYRGALSRSDLEIDGPEGPQQFLMQTCMLLAPDQEAAVRFRCDVDRQVQKHFGLVSRGTLHG